jgi:hypothetical protein
VRILGSGNAGIKKNSAWKMDSSSIVCISGEPGLPFTGFMMSGRSKRTWSISWSRDWKRAVRKIFLRSRSRRLCREPMNIHFFYPVFNRVYLFNWPGISAWSGTQQEFSHEFKILKPHVGLKRIPIYISVHPSNNH